MSNSEEALVVTCKQCNRTFSIGEDSTITTLSHVDQLFGAGDAIAGYPDLVGDFRGSEDRREGLLAESRMIASQIKNQLNAGQERYWRCRYCDNQENPNSFREGHFNPVQLKNNWWQFWK